jgi:hypothetical protein
MSTKLNGTITVHGSKPSTTAVVELHNADGDVVDQVQVDDRGRYTYNLSPGTWGLRVWDAHGHRGGRQVDIEDEEEKVLDIDLEEPEGGH